MLANAGKKSLFRSGRTPATLLKNYETFLPSSIVFLHKTFNGTRLLLPDVAEPVAERLKS